jgi:hypothetical protein
VRKHLAWASASLAIALAGCGTTTPVATSSPNATCINAGAPHHAYLVVKHLSGTSLQRCVGFSADTIDGKALMDQSGIPFQVQTFSFGLGMCAIDNEPAQFTECFPKGQPTWWLWFGTSGTWTLAQVGFDQIKLHDTDALGWHFVPASEASPSPPPAAKEG